MKLLKKVMRIVAEVFLPAGGPLGWSWTYVSVNEGAYCLFWSSNMIGLRRLRNARDVHEV